MRYIQMAVLAAGVWWAGVEARAQTIDFLTNGLVAYYPFNGNANDDSGHTNNGTITGATFVNGIFGTNSMTNALHFGNTDRVVVNDAPQIDPTNAITLAAWVNADNWGGNNRILQKGDLQYQFCAQNGFLDFTLSTTVSNNSLDTTLPSAGVWHQVVATYDGALMMIYIDGKESTQQPASGFIASTNNSGNANVLLNIGAKPDSVNPIDFMAGSICNVRIYNRALAANEVEQLHAFESVQEPVLGLFTAVELNFFTQFGHTYQVQGSSDLTNWMNLNGPVRGNGQTMEDFFPNGGTNAQFFRVEEVATNTNQGH